VSETLLCLNSDWHGSESPRLEAGSRRLAAELFVSVPYVDFGPSDSRPSRPRDGVFALDHIVERHAMVLDALRRENSKRVFTVGGTCGAESAPVAYLNERYRGRLGLVWFDAHGDLNTPESSPSGHFHGMVLRTLLGEGPHELTDAIPISVAASHLVLAGVRDLDAPEREYVDRRSIHLVEGLSASDRESLVSALKGADVDGVYVHIDVDVFNPESFGDALFSVPGGPTLVDVTAAIAAIGEAFEVVGVGVVEYIGEGDHSAAQLCGFSQDAGLWPPRS
jgi:arginase